ncbi:hypothetical protein BFJ63_vAg3581 [Fusarium oxysporum f. sp. narcissi]|uniref:Integral membrane protein n=1 Tax=Fusarium oxysporum f. sp. narcissi TaxID=451672 RepID=A0A4Q2W3B4_FUSOX|nr:hypothetical protein BFJ63_vAg3581 [Fusarium oxysporum f. sp. narcissi]
MESYYGGMGPMLNAVLWVQVVIFAIFVGLRLYTRSQILHSVGADDYLVVVALVFQIIYSAFVTAGTKYGLGRKFADIGNPDAYFRAVELEIYSQVAGLMVIGLGKCAVGIFLLRIVRNKFQKAFIWAFLAGTVFITLFSSIVVVVQCDPVQRTWDRRVPGTCWIDFSKVGLTVGSWFVVVDFCFAILPWFVIWELNMKRKEKITVACGLSLGIFAGICGIVRTVALNGLNASEYILDMLIWSATESTVTIMCSSIPVLRPLYVRFRYGSQGDSSGAASSYKLPMYGNYSGRKYGNSSMPGTEAISGSGPSNRTKAVSDHGDFTPLIFNAVLEELRHEADIFEQAGLIPVMDLCITALKFDKLLTDELVAEIKSAVAPFENVPEEQKNWHPGTHHQMLDLVHREGIRDEVMEERDARVKEFDSELISVEYRFCEH